MAIYAPGERHPAHKKLRKRRAERTCITCGNTFTGYHYQRQCWNCYNTATLKKRA